MSARVIWNDGSYDSHIVCIVKEKGSLHWGLTLEDAKSLRDGLAEKIAKAEKQATHDEELVVAFVQGVKWHQYETTGFTMFGSERDAAEEAAKKRLAEDRLGKLNPVTGGC